MNRSVDEANTIIEKIETVFAIYFKTLKPATVKSWMEILEPYTKDEIIKAFDDHVTGKSIDKNGNHSKFAPKPAMIIEHIRAQRDRKKAFAIKTEADKEKPCDPVIVTAWKTFIDEILGFGIVNAIHTTKTNIQLTREEVIKIVNREAAKMRPMRNAQTGELLYDEKGNTLYENFPDAIPDRYKLDEFWIGNELF